MKENSTYYQKLDPSSKALFQDRVEQFIDRKTITGRQDFLVTQEVRVTLAAAAVQLTLGLDTWDLEYFNQILIYPSEYKNPQTGQLHKGETNIGGFMCFSWSDFLKGNQTPDDKINLGLHEFGHALRFSGIQGNRTDYFFDNYFKRWLACAAEEFTRMRKGYGSIFRKYGAVNINEFFSVAVETFFESPQEFKTHLPELYHHTSILLNQSFDDNGHVILNCRENLMQQNKSIDIQNTEKILRFVLPPSGSMYACIIFAFFGLITLTGGGYKYPPAYILVTLSGLCFLNLVRKYVCICFRGKYVIIQKGFFFRNRFETKQLPLSQLVSFYVNNSEFSAQSKIASCTITYYYEGYFYEEELYFEFTQPKFDVLCDELIANYVHVHIVNQ